MSMYHTIWYAHGLVQFTLAALLVCEGGVKKKNLYMKKNLYKKLF